MIPYRLTNQHGFTIVQAIFILVVLGLLGGYMMTLFTVQQSTTTQALLQARAYQAARAGIEWGVREVVVNDIDSAVESFNVDDYSVTVSWAAGTPYDEAGQPTRHVYNIVSSVSYGSLGSPDYVSRRLEVKVHD